MAQGWTGNGSIILRRHRLKVVGREIHMHSFYSFYIRTFQICKNTRLENAPNLRTSAKNILEAEKRLRTLVLDTTATIISLLAL